MKNFARTSGTTRGPEAAKSRPDKGEEPSAAPQFRVRAVDKMASSPRACVAFSALDVVDWVREKLARLRNRLGPRLSGKGARNESESGVETQGSQNRPTIHRPTIIGHVLLALACLSAKPCLGGTIYNHLAPDNSFLINREYDTVATYIATNFTATDGALVQHSCGEVGDGGLSAVLNVVLNTEAKVMQHCPRKLRLEKPL